jgi:hypothetical protein
MDKWECERPGHYRNGHWSIRIIHMSHAGNFGWCVEWKGKRTDGVFNTLKEAKAAVAEGKVKAIRKA